MKYLAFILGMLPTLALAGTFSFAVVAPTQNTDGTAIPASGTGAIASHRIEYGSCTGTSFGTKAGEVTLTMPTVSGTSPNVAAGTYCVRAYAKTNQGSESVASNVAQAIVAPSTPNPPTLTVTTPTAFKMRQSVDGYQFVKIGTVPIGTTCDASHSVDGLNVVSRANVTLTSRFDTMPLVVFAKCG